MDAFDRVAGLRAADVLSLENSLGTLTANNGLAIGRRKICTSASQLHCSNS
jgi:hypothetical protein